MSSMPAEARTLLAKWVREQGWTLDDFRLRYAEAARSMNARADTVSARQAKRWFAGTVERPHPSASAVLEALCRQPIDDLMSPPDATGTAPDAATAQAEVPSRDLFEGTLSSELPPVDRHSSMSTDADETLRFLARAENAPAPEVIQLLWIQVRHFARSYGDHLSRHLDELVIARRAAFRLLDSPTEPRQARDIYLLAGLVCAMLAHASRDLGDTRRAIIYQDAALLCADRSGHPGLRIVARTEQAATAYWMKDFTHSVQYTDLATLDAERVRGSIAVLPFVQQARAYAALGDTDRSRHALTRSHHARDRVDPDDLDEIGGLMRLSLPEQLGIVAGAAAWLPDPAEAERAAYDAVTAYREAPYADRSHNSEAIAQADLAIARLRLHALDGAEDALRPVLAIPEPRRVLPIREGVQRAGTLLRADPYYESAPAGRRLFAEVQEFSRSSHAPREIRAADHSDAAGPSHETRGLTKTRTSDQH